jgi:hypothetical protein
MPVNPFRARFVQPEVLADGHHGLQGIIFHRGRALFRPLLRRRRRRGTASLPRHCGVVRFLDESALNQGRPECFGNFWHAFFVAGLN